MASAPRMNSQGSGVMPRRVDEGRADSGPSLVARQESVIVPSA